jgi:hypothetical protein
VHTVAVDGSLVITLYDNTDEVLYDAASAGVARAAESPQLDDLYWEALWVPSFNRYGTHAGTGETVIEMPLWLLASICLVWPVTSFIIARRRRKGRGFEVEAKPGAAVSPPESPPARASDR